MTSKPCNYRFIDLADGSVSFQLYPDKTEDSFKLNEVTPIENFIRGISRNFLP
jgi:hypothetical protein